MKKITQAQRRFLRYLLRAEGGWLPEDAFLVKQEVIVSLESRKLVRCERNNEGHIDAVTITSLGIAAYRWGSAALAAAA